MAGINFGSKKGAGRAGRSTDKMRARQYTGLLPNDIMDINKQTPIEIWAAYDNKRAILVSKWQWSRPDSRAHGDGEKVGHIKHH
jgi:hypothetical protein